MNTCAELFTRFLDSKEMHYSSYIDSDGDSVVDFPYQGKVVKCFFTGDDGTYLSLYLVYEHVPDDKLADAVFVCNELNTRFKWATFYVDDDKDLMVHDDAILSVESAADETFELLARMINISNDAKPSIMRALYA